MFTGKYICLFGKRLRSSFFPVRLEFFVKLSVARKYRKNYKLKKVYVNELEECNTICYTLGICVALEDVDDVCENKFCGIGL